MAEWIGTGNMSKVTDFESFFYFATNHYKCDVLEPGYVGQRITFTGTQERRFRQCARSTAKHGSKRQELRISKQNHILALNLRFLVRGFISNQLASKVRTKPGVNP
jgi:hypothetical protein